MRGFFFLPQQIFGAPSAPASASDVFCLSQLILQSEEKELPQQISLCVTGELFFAVCEMTHFFYILFFLPFHTNPNKRSNTMLLRPRFSFSGFTRIVRNVITCLVLQVLEPFFSSSVTNKLL